VVYAGFSIWTTTAVPAAGAGARVPVIMRVVDAE
jgi:hypothetical protein